MVLIEAGANANPSSKDHHYSSPLRAAVGKGNLEIVDELIKRGARLNPSSEDRHFPTQLQAAAGKGNLEILNQTN